MSYPARLFPLFLLFIAAGCSLDYRQAQVADTRPEDVPETILRGALFTVVRPGYRTFTVRAERAESYPERNEQQFWNVTFQELDRDEKLLTRGSAERITYFTENDNVELSGDISFYSATQEAGIAASYLYWDDGNRTLTAHQDEAVTVTRDNGSVIKGKGFRADMRINEVTFSDGVEGTLVTEEDSGES